MNKKPFDEIMHVKLNQQDRSIEMNGSLILKCRKQKHFDVIWSVAVGMASGNPSMRYGVTADYIRKNSVEKNPTQLWLQTLGCAQRTPTSIYQILRAKGGQEVTSEYENEPGCTALTEFLGKKLFIKISPAEDLGLAPNAKLFTIAPGAEIELVRSAGQSLDVKQTRMAPAKTHAAETTGISNVSEEYDRMGSNRKLATKTPGTETAAISSEESIRQEACPPGDEPARVCKRSQTEEGAARLRDYAESLIAEIHSTMAGERLDKLDFENRCITPLVRTLDEYRPFGEVHEMSCLVDAACSVILGEPGSGKTYALFKLALSLVRRDTIRAVPVYIALADFSQKFEVGKPCDFEMHIDETLKVLGVQSISELSGVPGTLIVLLLDGWDDIGNEEARRKVRIYLTRTKHHCIITTRPGRVAPPPQAIRYVMEPLSARRIREYLRLRIKSYDKVDDLIDWIEGNAEISKLATNPLNLANIEFAFKEEGCVPNLTKTMLYTRTFEARLWQYHKMRPYEGFKSKGEDITSKIISVLQHLAYQGLEKRSGTSFSLEQLHDAANEILHFVPAKLDRYLAGRLGIIRYHHSGRFEFFHKRYQEFLSAKYIQGARNTIDDKAKKLNTREFASCLQFVVGLMSGSKDALQLIEKVEIHDPSDYCRSISEGGFSEKAKRRLLAHAMEWGEGNSPRIPVRLGLARSLAEAGPVVLNALYFIAEDKSKRDYQRRSAVEAIARLESQPEKFDRLLLKLLPGSSNGLLWHTTEHVGKRRLTEGKEVLQANARSPEPITAGDSVWALRQLGVRPRRKVSDFVDALCECLFSDDDHIQGHALRTLGRLRIREAIPILRDYLRRENARYRWIVAEAASLIGGREALRLLDTMLSSEDVTVMASAIRAVGEVRGKVPEETIDKVRQHKNDNREPEYFDQTLGRLAESTLSKLRHKGMPGRLAQIYVGRHCRTKWNVEKILQGTQDKELCEAGREEASKNARAFKALKIHRIFCSNTQRAGETARIYARYLGVAVHTSPRLREIDHGIWEGQYIEKLRADKSTRFAEWMENPAAFEIPGSSESITSAQQRFLEEIRDIAQSFRGERVLVVSHKHIIAALMCAVQKKSLKEFSSLINESVEPCLLPPDAVADICRDVTEDSAEAT